LTFVGFFLIISSDCSTEYRSHILTRLAGGNAYYGCYGLAVTIFAIGIIRDTIYERALRSQPTLDIIDNALFKIIAVGLFAVGNVLVVSSMWALGVTGTYLGDYFGILMDEKVESFPFNVTSAPMYYGSTLSFLATAIWFAKPAGIMLTLEVLVVYLIALRFEEYVSFVAVSLCMEMQFCDHDSSADM